MRASILEFASIYPGDSAGDALRRVASTAQAAEAAGYHRMWFTEHHNIGHVAAASPPVLIAHAAAHTSRIRLGSGGVMLPNHTPYVVAEQFSTLAALYDGRIDVGLGRAPGTDPLTLGRALRRHPGAPGFDDDVRDLRNFMSGRSPIPGVRCVPADDPGRGAGAPPIFILGSSTHSASLAAGLGMPYVFASHFAPDQLDQALAIYRRDFTPSEDLAAPYVIVGMNALCTDDATDIAQVREHHVAVFAGPSASPAARARALTMLSHFAAGTEEQVRESAGAFVERTGADELMLVHRAPSAEVARESLLRCAAALGLSAHSE